MYTFSSKLKTFSLILMAVGLLGIGYGFYSAPKDIQDVEALLAADSHGGHGEATHATPAEEHSATAVADHATPVKAEAAHTDTTHAAAEVSHETAGDSVDAAPVVAHDAQANAVAHDAHADAEHKEHLEHVLHQLSNKPWAAVYVACIFFMLLSLGTLAFYAIQQVAQAGWSPVLFRVMQGITNILYYFSFMWIAF